MAKAIMTEPKCPRCGSTDIELIDASVYEDETQYYEGLVWKCMKCGYEWVEETECWKTIEEND